MSAARPGDPPSTAIKEAARVAVWDPVVRYGHWLLVIAFAIAYLSSEEESANGPDLLHVWGGYVVGAIVVLRVIWGFVGPHYARFSAFACGPVSALRYLVALLRGTAQRYLGHSPAGGAMVIALLVFLAGTVATGLVAYGEIGKGPLARAGTSTPAHAAVVPAPANGATNGEAREAGREESGFAELHSTLANITLALVILHILGVGLASVVHRENLVAAMITGRKRA